MTSAQILICKVVIVSFIVNNAFGMRAVLVKVIRRNLRKLYSYLYIVAACLCKRIACIDVARAVRKIPCVIFT